MNTLKKAELEVEAYIDKLVEIEMEKQNATEEEIRERFSEDIKKIKTKEMKKYSSPLIKREIPLSKNNGRVVLNHGETLSKEEIKNHNERVKEFKRKKRNEIFKYDRAEAKKKRIARKKELVELEALSIEAIDMSEGKYIEIYINKNESKKNKRWKEIEVEFLIEKIKFYHSKEAIALILNRDVLSIKNKLLTIS